MSKSSKPQVSRSQSTSSFQMPSFVEQFQIHALDRARDVLNPYLTPGYGVAGFNADQSNAFQGVRDMASAHGGGLDPNAYKTWMNPYQEAVVDTTTGRIQRQGDEALNAIRGRQAAGSAFGGVGARSAFAAQQAQEGTQRQIAETTAQLMSQGYTQAQAQALVNRGLQQESLQALMGIGNQQQTLEQKKLDQPLMAVGMMHGMMPQQFSTVTDTSGTQTTPGQQGPGAGQIIGGLAMKALPMLFSDRNAKTDIKKLGKDPVTGLDMFAYRYKGDPKSYPKVVGPMAQDWEKAMPGSTRRIGGNLVIQGL